jgi:hypothetical protein
MNGVTGRGCRADGVISARGHLAHLLSIRKSSFSIRMCIDF